MALTLKVTNRFRRGDFILMEPDRYKSWLAEPDHRWPSWTQERAIRRRELEAARKPARKQPHAPACATAPSAPARPKASVQPEPMPRDTLHALALGYDIHTISEWQRQGLLPLW